MKTENKLFNQIEQASHSHEEEYIPGAWEDFCKKRKKERLIVLFRRLGAVAALVLLFIGIALLYLMQPSVEHNGTKLSRHLPDQTKKTIINDAVKGTAQTTAVTAKKNKLSPVGQYNPIAYKKAITQPGIIEKGNDSLPALAQQAPKIVQGNSAGPHQQIAATDTVINTAMKKSLLTRQPDKAPVKKSRTILDLLNDTSFNAKPYKNAQKKQGNFNYSVVFAPSVGNQKINLGTGMEIAYKIGDHFYVSSGLAYSSLHALVNGSTNGIADRQLQGVNLDLSGIAVPLGLQYQTRKGFYATAGVLAMTVVSNHLEYSYLNTMPEAVTAMNANGQYAAIRVVSTQVKEASPEKLNNYLGFYTFSVGKKTSFGNKQFNVGPFINIPFSPVSSENIRLMQGGVHLSFGF